MWVYAIGVSSDIVNESVLDLDSGDDFFSGCALGGLYNVPFRSKVHVCVFISDLGERGDESVSEVGESLEDHPVADVVVQDGKLVGP